MIQLQRIVVRRRKVYSNKCYLRPNTKPGGSGETAAGRKGGEMQYLLTEEEYDNMVPLGNLEDIQDANRILRELFFKHSKHKCPRYSRNITASMVSLSYCTGCPLWKTLSSIGGTKELRNAICPHDKKLPK